MSQLEEILQNLYGVGPATAKSIIIQLHDIFTGFESNINEEKVRKILKSHKNIFDSLPVATKIDLLYNPIKIIPREFITIIDQELHKYCKNIKFTIAGSYRRGKLTSRDIDLVVLSKGKNTIDKLIADINDNSKIVHIDPPFASGPNKITTLFEIDVNNFADLLKGYAPRQLIRADNHTKVRVKIDIFITNADEYIFALLFATGSGIFNVRMRAVAKKKNMLLNQRGLFRKVGDKLEQIPIKTEQEIFSILGMKYREPKDRIK
jgi:DNA polymerase beta